MCGRFTVVLKAEDLEQQFQVKSPADFEFISYNISPSQAIPIIHLDEQGEKRLSLMEWSLLPPWAKSLKQGPRPINARLETADQNPLFNRVAVKNARFCALM